MRSELLPVLLALGCVITLSAPRLRADARPAALFTDHTVLQRDTAIPIWGTAKRGEPVTVSFAGQRISTKADRDGRWRVDLAPLPANATPADLLVKGRRNTVTLRDVLVGDVWLCSGQSNMEWPVRLCAQADAEIAAAQLPLIRHYKVANQMAHGRPADDVQGGWSVCSPETAPHFTAIGFFFARELHRELRVPIGLLNVSWGGTPIESWLSPRMLAATPHAAAVASAWAKTVAEYPEKKAAHDRAVAEWEQRAAAAKAAGRPEPGDHPWRPAGPGLPEEPSVLWHGMVAPVAPYGIRGFLWYQGESNVGRATEYRDLFPALIDGWRTAWARPEAIATAPLPFLFVQLPNYADRNPGGDAWARLREAQTAALALPATGMAVALEQGESDNLHPTRKQEIARRLALVARVQVYGEGLDHSGPVFESASLEADGSIRIRLRHADVGLVCRGPRLRGFQIAGADRVFQTAEATIEGDTVVVRSKAVPAPLAVRYGFVNDPQPPANLYNGAGLPAAPFRTDRW